MKGQKVSNKIPPKKASSAKRYQLIQELQERKGKGETDLLLIGEKIVTRRKSITPQSEI